MSASEPNPNHRTDDRATFGEYEDDLRKTERKVAGEIDPGGRALVVAVCILILLVTLVLPHAGEAKGLDVLTFTETAAAEHTSLPSKIFVYMTLIFAIGFSLLALVTRRWVFALIALCGSAVTAVAGMLAIWTRNTVGVDSVDMQAPSGAGIGLIVGWIVVIVLTFHWARAVWARTNYHLALEAERRERAAEQEALGRSLQKVIGDDPKTTDEE
ncbi:hypothetical protein [Gordonia humi]|uniref:Transmembrane protein n=1 Tax=Gordonia humi TaxID=686429 RepID=A0A840F9G6_9ACTN|nr:hypothetical protein [Gordonia humi]MBB4136157.1 hypothetical protein [Gordonia humi]